MAAASLDRLSPLDGRYADRAAPLAAIFSEAGLIERRWRLEIEWLLALAELPDCGLELDAAATAKLRELAAAMPADAPARIKEIEAEARHDLKAVEIHLAERLTALDLAAAAPWLHFGCTSWDINNLAHSLMLRAAQEEVLDPLLGRLQEKLAALATEHARLPMLGRTHGQPATPTTLGKELRVFERRLDESRRLLAAHRFAGKFNGATGNYSALTAAAPGVDWEKAARGFVEGLGLGFATHTTQIEPYDNLARYCGLLAGVNSILLDLARDASLYIGMDYLVQRAAAAEVGSSTMPHKTNPIDFENAEGNLQIANALLGCLREALPLSRLQRDLSNSTLLRNLGVALGHGMLAWDSALRGLERVAPDPDALRADLDRNWQVLAEAVQTRLRAAGDAAAYDRLKELTKGLRRMDEAQYQDMVRQLVPDEGSLRDELLALRPETYLGKAVELALLKSSDGG
ncbi:MAG: adenylosuccinate lyase [Betaproteobacteria bacterium AqS2]|uniref:Adenylosuccinate lyase n=1 Tax=Candidatus Amphirhobacter heronislandensis TaxID=1732024 RepID=A0A930XWN1_9GAMM|nr:adenylosuccinate lyase [Betaproteobacteria bacterium AqS2]